MLLLLISIIDLVLLDFLRILTRDTKSLGPRQLGARFDRVTIYVNPSLFWHPRTDGNNYGNFGLYDQVNALKWVYDEIHHFGGGQGSLSFKAAELSYKCSMLRLKGPL